MIWPFRKPKVQDPEIARLRYENAKLMRQVDDANTRANAEAMEAIRRGNDLTNMMAANAELSRQLAEACRERDELIAADSEALAHALAELDEVRATSDHAFNAGFDSGWSERLKQERANIVTTIDDASRLLRYAAALSAIAARPTPSAKADARDMARIAREALE